MARRAVLGNIEGNLTALEAVLEDCSCQSIDEFVILGNVSGRCTRPVECLERLAGYPSVKGGYERLLLGDVPWVVSSVNFEKALLWSRGLLASSSHINAIRQWPLELMRGRFKLLNTTSFMIYLHSTLPPSLLDDLPEGQLLVSPSPGSFVLFEDGTSVQEPPPGISLRPRLDRRTVLGIGSVGVSPCAPGPTARFAVVDDSSGSVDLCAVSYDPRPEIDRLRESPLPDDLVHMIES